jgi:DNA-binding HxlR family transcriptional regulator
VEIRYLANARRADWLMLVSDNFVTKEIIDRALGLKGIGTVSTRGLYIDIAAATARKIAVVTSDPAELEGETASLAVRGGVSLATADLLRDGSRRFNDIKRNTAGISQQMLTRTLRGLERDGIVTRTILPTSPPQVEYSLTELGHSMSEPVLAFGQWVSGHLAEFEAARVQYDRRNGVL